jgi:WD40 repeat protein
MIDKGICTNTQFRTEGTASASALCFTKNDDNLIFGMDDGNILIYSKVKNFNYKFNSSLEKEHASEIRSMKFSFDYSYMASLDKAGNVMVWNGGSLSPCFKIPANKQNKMLEFHPFVQNEFILGQSKPPGLFLFKVAAKKSVASYQKDDDNVELTSIAFKKSTGELFANFHFRGEEFFYNRLLNLAKLSLIWSVFLNIVFSNV